MPSGGACSSGGGASGVPRWEGRGGRRGGGTGVLGGGWTGRRGLAPGAAVIAVGGGASACGGQRDASAPPAAAGPVALLYWRAFAEAHLQARSIQAVLDDYQARNPGRVTVEIGESG